MKDLQKQIDNMRAAVSNASPMPLPPPAPSVPLPCCTYCGADHYAAYKVDCYWFYELRADCSSIPICRRQKFVDGECDGCDAYIAKAKVDEIVLEDL